MEIRNIGSGEIDPGAEVKENPGEGKLGGRSVRQDNRPGEQGNVSRGIENGQNPNNFIQQARNELLNDDDEGDDEFIQYQDDIEIDFDSDKGRQRVNQYVASELTDGVDEVKPEDVGKGDPSSRKQRRFISDLIQIAANAYGNGAFEGRSGGEGHIGLIGDEVVKFNTHSGEYSEGGLEALKTGNPGLYNAMMASSTRLGVKLRGLLDDAILLFLQDKVNLTTEQQHIISAMRMEMRAICNGQELLTRKNAVEFLSMIFEITNLADRQEIEQIVWQEAERIAPKLSTEKIGDTRALFMEKSRGLRRGQAFLGRHEAGGDSFVKTVVAAGRAEFARLFELDAPSFPMKCNAGIFTLTNGARVDYSDYLSILRERRFKCLLGASRAMLEKFSGRCANPGDRRRFDALYAQLARLERAVDEASSPVEIVNGTGDQRICRRIKVNDYRDAVNELSQCLMNFAYGLSAKEDAHNRYVSAPLLAARQLCARLGQIVRAENRSDFGALPAVHTNADQEIDEQELSELAGHWRTNQAVSFDELETLGLEDDAVSRFESLQDDLISIAAIAYGDHRGEKSAGGKGHIGLVNGEVVKFNTHRNEYESADAIDDETARRMRESCGKLIDRMSGMVESAFRLLAAAENRELTYTENERKSNLLAWLADLKSRDSFFSRADAAHLVTEICGLFVRVGGLKDLQQEVWDEAARQAPALSTRNVRDTRAAFTAKWNAARGN